MSQSTSKEHRVIGFNQGQAGDLCMNLVACRAFKEMFPKSEIIFGINRRYEQLAPLFLENPLVDGVHIWDGYDNWPTQADKDHIKSERFTHVFNPMPHHTREDWYLDRHQTEEVCWMHGLRPPNDLSVSLNKYFSTPPIDKRRIAVNLHAATRAEAKTPSPAHARAIIKALEGSGYMPVQIGLPNEEQYCKERFVGTFFESVQFVLSCGALLTVDSAMAWIASGYKFPTVGLYTPSYYPNALSSVTWQPRNDNLIALEAGRIDEISVDSVIGAISSL